MTQIIEFPEYTGLRCLMMPYIQGDPTSLPEGFEVYNSIVRDTFLQNGEVGYLTIDESEVKLGTPHRGARAKYGRALHTEAGYRPEAGKYSWGGSTWGSGLSVSLDEDTEILISNNIDGTCAVWNVEHRNTSYDGDIGYAADQYPYEDAEILSANVVKKISIFTPHESLPIFTHPRRQFLRIVGVGVHGRELHFTENLKVDFAA